MVHDRKQRPRQAATWWHCTAAQSVGRLLLCGDGADSRIEWGQMQCRGTAQRPHKHRQQWEATWQADGDKHTAARGAARVSLDATHTTAAATLCCTPSQPLCRRRTSPHPATDGCMQRHKVGVHPLHQWRWAGPCRVFPGPVAAADTSVRCAQYGSHCRMSIIGGGRDGRRRKHAWTHAHQRSGWIFGPK